MATETASGRNSERDLVVPVRNPIRQRRCLLGRVVKAHRSGGRGRTGGDGNATVESKLTPFPESVFGTVQPPSPWSCDAAGCRYYPFFFGNHSDIVKAIQYNLGPDFLNSARADDNLPNLGNILHGPGLHKNKGVPNSRNRPSGHYIFV